MKITSYIQPSLRQAGPQPPTNSDPTPPEEEGPKDKILPAFASGVVAGAAAYGGAYVGAIAGMNYGALFTPISAPTETLLNNMATGGRIGLIGGALSFGILGAVVAYQAVDALQS